MNFIKRNTPIIAMGFVTLGILLAIIFLSQKQPERGPALESVDEAELIAEHTYVKGPQGAPVTLVEFSDYQCPFCAQAAPVIDRILEKYPNDVRFALRHLPLPQHPYARKAAEAAQIAGEQGKFWEYHDALFANQENMKTDDLLRYAKTVGLDVEKFKSELESGRYSSVINKDVATARRLGINSTPTFYLNGKKLALNSFGEIEGKIKQEIEFQRAGSSKESTEATRSNFDQPAQTQYETLEIEFTDDGFSPKDALVRLGQKIKWTNKTEQDIRIVQLVESFEELKGGVDLKPGESFEFVPDKDRLWTYKEEESGFAASIFVDSP